MSPAFAPSLHLTGAAFARLFVVLCVLMGAVTAAGAETFGKGLDAFNSGDYAAAYAIWLPLAEHGDANSQSALAYLFHEGEGTRQDSKAAAKWYYRAALQGEPTAQSFLCQMHLNGDGVQRDLVLALMWCELSTDGGERWTSLTRDRVISKMTTAERDKAWELVTRWRTDHAEATPGEVAAAVKPVPAGGREEARAR